MQSIKNIKLFMVVGLLLHVGLGFAQEGAGIMARLNRMKQDEGKVESNAWKPTGPTQEDIQAATKVEGLAVKGSREDQLISAVKNGHLKNVETCLAAGSGLEARDKEGMTVLMIAAKAGYTDIVSKLINKGANVHAGDKFGLTPLFMATEESHIDTVKILMAAGAASDSNFESIFMSVVFKGNIEMVKALIVKDINIRSSTLETTYMMALNKRNTELVSIIKDLKSQCT